MYTLLCLPPSHTDPHRPPHQAPISHSRFKGSCSLLLLLVGGSFDCVSDPKKIRSHLLSPAALHRYSKRLLWSAAASPVSFLKTFSSLAGSTALPSNIAYFGSSQEEDDLDEEENEEEEEVRNGGGVHLHSGGSSGQAPATSSCHSTPRKGKPPTRQPLNGHGKEGRRLIPMLIICLNPFVVQDGKSSRFIDVKCRKSPVRQRRFQPQRVFFKRRRGWKSYFRQERIREGPRSGRGGRMKGQR